MFGDFVQVMRENKLEIKHQGGENFKDDWGGSDDAGVTCYWSVCKLRSYIRCRQLLILKRGLE